MRQLLLRIPDDLHRRLAARAQREGVSINALANKVLSAAAPPPPPSDDDIDVRRLELREKARDLGVLVESPAPSVPPAQFVRALKDTEGVGPVVDELWADGR
ncbi:MULTISPECIES: toxin-antitoxin system HicB family antitoxin [Jiangella]|uniref:HicB family protein n=1 Tax=Jiangella alba TaxID=561176 RepID=A0A1H5MUV1_9ACTN|nr:MULTISPECIES: toxin-antitoxin system HicB family antitoxin [Jiangella]SDS83579.1 HicB family protein [Jiangella sp. DSM 45060]SEE93043.1 HicB family protein [Jiangella alba]